MQLIPTSTHLHLIYMNDINAIDWTNSSNSTNSSSDDKDSIENLPLPTPTINLDVINNILLWFFLIVFSIELVLYFFFSVRTTIRVKASRNLFNYIMAFTYSAFLFVRIFGIIYTLVAQKNYSFMQQYLELQLPMDLLDIALIAFVFSLSEVFTTLSNLKDIRRSQQETTKESLITNEAPSVNKQITLGQIGSHF
jgi:hypothetical protein